ncbi:MAG: hypothetical protein K2X44_05310, partial [Magnetospirillum sp.]|nr:hypothetical protein [Magnetospirillum sp.]
GPETIAVIAVGDSMRPAGLNPGDLVFCHPGDPIEGTPVLVELADGKAALKRWGGEYEGWITLQGWLEPENGVQQPYHDRRRCDQLRRVLPVAGVKECGAGEAGLAVIRSTMKAGEVGASMAAPKVVMLASVAAEVTLQWLDAHGLELGHALTARLIGKVVQAVAEPSLSDAEIKAEAVRVLDEGMQMLRP